MKKHLLILAALTAMSLPAAAQESEGGSPTVRYIQLTSVNQMIEGGQYVIAAYNHHWGTGDNLDKRILMLYGSDSKFVKTDNAALSTDAAIWTAGHTEVTCTGMPHNQGRLFTLSQNGKFINQHTSGNKTENATTTTSNDVTNAFEFMVVNAPSGASAENTYFAIHYNKISQATWMNKGIWVDKDGQMGFGSMDQNATAINVTYGNSGNKWSTYFLVYLPVVSDNLTAAATALWTGLVEDECYKGAGDTYVAKLRALPVPDAANLTFENLEAEIKAAFDQALFEMDADLTFTFSAQYANFYNEVGHAESSFSCYAMGDNGSFVTMSAVLNSDHNHLLANMQKSSDNKFNLYNGHDVETEEMYSALYTVESFFPAYRVTGLSFTASSATEGQTITKPGGTVVALTSEEQNITIPGNSFILNGSNQAVVIGDILVKLMATDTPNSIPSETGWYEVTLITGTRDSNAANNSVVAAGHKIHNTETPYRQSDTNFYSFKIAQEGNKPAAKYIRFNVNGSSVKAQSANGLYVGHNGLSQRTEANNIQFVEKENGTILIGPAGTGSAHWVYWKPSGNNTEEAPFVGGGSSNTAHRWAIYKVDPTETYDIWSVTITGAPNATEVRDDVRVTCTNAANKGIASVYNNGYFFITKNTQLSDSDFTMAEYESEDLTPYITVDNANHTVTVTYLSKEEYIAHFKEVVESGFAPYVKEALFDSATVNGIVEESMSAIDSVTEDTPGSRLASEQAAQIKQIAVSEPTTAHVNSIFASVAKADGKLVYFLNSSYANTYMTDQEVTGQNYTKRVWGKNEKYALNSLWKLEIADPAVPSFYIQNYGDGMYIQNFLRNGSAENDLPMVESKDDASVFTFEFYQGTTHSGFGIKDTENNSYHYLHAKGTNARLVKWSVPSQSNPASGWTTSLVEQEELEFSTTMVNSKHQMTFVGAVPHSGVTYAEHHNIEIWATSAVDVEEEETPAAPETLRRRAKTAYVASGEEPVSYGRISEATTADGNTTIVLSERLNEGVYEVRIPAAIFMIGDKHNKQSVSTISVDEDGVPSGIDEVAAAGEPKSADVIYDLQGRRLAKPVRGINIINGKKIYVK
ncbi:MAG: hypothetical protein NC301_08110 [Bacteroides sp.]|nr:hypothetical protein [Bacteroides sp.]MCM1380158.1 hypothetical protein [Bacteroides sp.]MCM1446466.1 hypothetical protein [Prevotella sp.]